MESADSLKKLLQNELGEDELDYGKVLELANKLSQLDPEYVRFSVDASHVSRLGMELVAKQETAVAELVKNAFDADADTVDLVFRGVQRAGGELEIYDNGLGMNREQLVNGFMRISTKAKLASPVSPRYQRQRAGRKGIGRFAAQRLGTSLLLRTQVHGAPASLQLEIDWNAFDIEGDIAQIAHAIRESESLPHAGTSLTVKGLRDAWSEAQIKRAFRYISGLLQPFPLAKKTVGSQQDPGFRAAFYLETEGNLFPIASEEQSILAHAIATISGEVTEHGVPIVSLKSERRNIEIDRHIIELEPRIKSRSDLVEPGYDLLTGIKFTAKYFIQDDLPSGTRATVREVLNRRGGIRLYRNGFRVLPYGEAYDDWLGLQRSSALREILPPHHNSNFIGFIEITDVDGARFEETASREGLVENSAFGQLQDFVYRALMSGVIEVARVRRKKLFSSDKNHPGGDRKEPVHEDPVEQASYVIEAIVELTSGPSIAVGESQPGSLEVGGALITDDDVSSSTTTPVASAQYAIDAVRALGKRTQELIEEVGMLRVLASFGLTIGEFTHEVRHALAALAASLQTSGDDGSEAVQQNMALLKSYVRYFDDAVTDNAQRMLVVQEIRDLVSEFGKIVEPTMERQGVALESRFDGWDLFVRPMHRSEWASILLNLFTNALKAIHRAGSKGRILAAARREDGYVVLTFSDTGDGIPPENRERVFDAFYTTSSSSGSLANDAEKLVGTGLGLKIVRDIVESSGGEIYVGEPLEGYSTTIYLELPEATEEEIGDARY